LKEKMVKEIRKKEAFQFLRQAEEFLESAGQNMAENRLNAAGFSAIRLRNRRGRRFPARRGCSCSSGRAGS
jgi:hypothetical protein